jgi:hypothetical protein
MVDGLIRGERLRPLGLWRTAALGRVSEELREPAGSLKAISDSRAGAEAIDGNTGRGSGDRLERLGAASQGARREAQAPGGGDMFLLASRRLECGTE